MGKARFEFSVEAKDQEVVLNIYDHEKGIQTTIETADGRFAAVSMYTDPRKETQPCIASELPGSIGMVYLFLYRMHGVDFRSDLMKTILKSMQFIGSQMDIHVDHAGRIVTD